MADPRIDGRLRQPLPFHLGLPCFDVGRSDSHRVFARETEEGEHGVRLVALDVMRRSLDPSVAASVQKATAFASAGSLAWRGTRAVRPFPGLVFLFLPVLPALKEQAVAMARLRGKEL